MRNGVIFRKRDREKEYSIGDGWRELQGMQEK